MRIAVDFDGTIVTNEYPRIGKPMPFAVESLLKLQQEGHQIILWTCRCGDELEEAVQFCASYGLEFYAINANYPEENTMLSNPRFAAQNPVSRKIVADVYIDDRNLGGMPEWGEIYRLIQEME